MLIHGLKKSKYGDGRFTQVVILTDWNICELKKNYCFGLCIKWVVKQKDLLKKEKLLSKIFWKQNSYNMRANDLYVICVKLNDLQENLDLWNLCHLA